MTIAATMKTTQDPHFREYLKSEVHAGVKVRSEPVLSDQDRRRRDVLRGIMVSCACTNGGFGEARRGWTGASREGTVTFVSSRAAPMGSKGSAALLM